MHCSRCGTQMDAPARFCSTCGAPASKRAKRQAIRYGLLAAGVALAGLGGWSLQAALAQPDSSSAVSMTGPPPTVPSPLATMSNSPTAQSEATTQPAASATTSAIHLPTAKPKPTPTPKPQPIATPAVQQTPRAAKAATLEATTAPPRPKGTVQILSYQRLPDSQQDEYACDKLVLTIANRSNTSVDTVTVTFATSYLEATPDGGSSTGSPKTGPNVARTATAGIAPYDKTEVAFSVCVPSAKSPFVYASPAKILWNWT